MNPDPGSLDRLHDVIAPPPVPLWPPAPGWYWLIGIAIAIALYLALRGILRWQHNRYRREALAECRRQMALLASPQMREAALAQLAVLLKRAALSVFPRERVACLTGPQWQAFLDRSAAMQGFGTEAGVLLERAAYGAVTSTELDEGLANEAAALVRRWLVRHRIEDRAKADE